MKQKYISPQLDVSMLSREDLLNASDTLKDGSDLFGTDENN